MALVRWSEDKGWHDAKITARTTLTVGIDNLTDAPSYRDRYFYYPNRTNRSPSVYEHRLRNRHVMPYVTVKHSFG